MPFSNLSSGGVGGRPSVAPPLAPTTGAASAPNGDPLTQAFLANPLGEQQWPLLQQVLHTLQAATSPQQVTAAEQALIPATLYLLSTPNSDAAQQVLQSLVIQARNRVAGAPQGSAFDPASGVSPPPANAPALASPTAASPSALGPVSAGADPATQSAPVAAPVDWSQRMGPGATAQSSGTSDASGLTPQDLAAATPEQLAALQQAEAANAAQTQSLEGLSSQIATWGKTPQGQAALQQAGASGQGRDLQQAVHLATALAGAQPQAPAGAPGAPSASGADALSPEVRQQLLAALMAQQGPAVPTPTDTSTPPLDPSALPGARNAPGISTGAAPNPVSAGDVYATTPPGGPTAQLVQTLDGMTPEQLQTPQSHNVLDGILFGMTDADMQALLNPTDDQLFSPEERQMYNQLSGVEKVTFRLQKLTEMHSRLVSLLTSMLKSRHDALQAIIQNLRN